jgi:glutamyl-tRNA(Gln) amidotransferase subunit D
MSDNYKGYRDPALGVLKENHVQVWSDVELVTKQGGFKGIILPRSETADARHVVMKLPPTPGT